MDAFSRSATLEKNLISNEGININRTTTYQQGTILGVNNREIFCLRGHHLRRQQQRNILLTWAPLPMVQRYLSLCIPLNHRVSQHPLGLKKYLHDLITTYSICTHRFVNTFNQQPYINLTFQRTYK